MEGDGPDLEALESATRAQLRARELGKIMALIPNPQPNAPVPESIGKENLNTVHYLTGSLIQTNHLRILKNPQNGLFKGIFSSVSTDGS